MERGNEQPSSKRQRVPSDEALVSDDIIVNKRAKPNLSEACAKAYKNYRNTAVRLARYENQRDFYKKYLDLGVVPAYMRYNAVPSIGRNNPVLKTRWDETVTCMQRKLLDLQHDESIRIVNDTRKKAEQERQALKDASASDAELTEAKLAIRHCTDKIRRSDKAERLARLDKRRTRVERSPAPAEKRENSQGKRQQNKNFQNTGGSNSRRNPTKPQRKGKKSKPTNFLSTLMKMIQSYQ